MASTPDHVFTRNHHGGREQVRVGQLVEVTLPGSRWKVVELDSSILQSEGTPAIILRPRPDGSGGMVRRLYRVCGEGTTRLRMARESAAGRLALTAFELTLIAEEVE